MIVNHKLGLRSSVSENGLQTNFIFSGTEAITETSANGQVLASNIRGYGLLAQKDPQGRVYDYLSNAHGDITGLVNANGEMVNCYTYDAYGQLTEKVEGQTNRFNYSGEQLDSLTSEYYLRARYYVPSVGRFMQEDTYRGTLEDPQTLNLYTYVVNNPLRYVDPSGHRFMEDSGGGGYVDPSKNQNAQEYLKYAGDQVDRLKDIVNGISDEALALMTFGISDLILPEGIACINNKADYYRGRVLFNEVAMIVSTMTAAASVKGTFGGFGTCLVTGGGGCLVGLISGQLLVASSAAATFSGIKMGVNNDLYQYYKSTEGTGKGAKLTGKDITFSDKLSKTKYKDQVPDRGWTNDSIADAINNPVKTGTSKNPYTENDVTLYYVDDAHYVAVDNGTGKVIQVADLKKADWKMDLTK